ncbi:hypothetical protein F4774DRAFT_416648 [Daldinia eschscholtzii]|nr:hypothetical protein F4774DRAFT_416648 [Daldinia eschscholtzii]
MATGPQAFYCLWQKEAIREKLFQLLSKEDICNVRLSSSACCNLVTKRLFLRTHLTFTSTTFTRQSRIEALSRIGQHIEHLTFYFPHSEATFLAPLVHPETGREIAFLYKPHTSMASVLERPKFANSGLGEILTQQYPPLFHAASNVPSFINAMKHLPNMRHLTIRTPGQDPKERYRRDIVDYALISLRISLERAPMRKLTKLSLSSVHPSAFIYLRHVIGFGCLPSAARRWKQIKKLKISVEAWDFYGPSPGLDHLKMIDDYIRDFSTSLEKLTFNWLGRKGPCPLSLAADPLFAPPRSSQKLFNEVTSPMSPLPPAPSRKPIVFRKLRFMAVQNTTMSSSQVAELVAAHRHCVRKYDFENTVLINNGSWDDALAPLLNKSSRSSRWVRESMATITEDEKIHSMNPTENLEDLSADSPAVSAASQELLVLDLDGGEGEGEDELAEQNDEFELPSDVEAARQASLSFPNKLKKRTVTKRRRRRKDKHEPHEDNKKESHARHHHRQASEDSIDQPHDGHRRHRRHRHQEPQESFERQQGSHGFDQSSRPSNEFVRYHHEPPQLSISPQSSRHRLFGEIESICSTSSRRLFGEVSQLIHSGSEPELTHSPFDDSDSVVDEYFRPSTPTTTPMDISAPILNTAPGMPILLEPHVYDPTAELCCEITAVQRDIEAEEAQRRVAEDAELQTSALKRAKELVLSRLGREYSSNTSNSFAKRGVGGPKKESFGAGSFLSSSRFREGLFGKSTSSALIVVWPRVRLWIVADAPMTKFLHAARGKPAWAFVAGAGQDPVPQELCFGLAARGFNVVLYGVGVGSGSGSCDSMAAVQRLEALRAKLLKAYPENKYRIVVADAAAPRDAEEGFIAEVVGSLEGVNLTVLVNCIGEDGGGIAGGIVPPQLNAALISLLKRSAPALVINVTPSTVDHGNGTQLCSPHKGSEDISHDGVSIVSCSLEGAAASSQGKLSLPRLTSRDLAEAVLLYAASNGKDGIVYPHWTQAMLRMTRKTLLGMAADQISFIRKRNLSRE